MNFILLLNVTTNTEFYPAHERKNVNKCWHLNSYEQDDCWHFNIHEQDKSVGILIF